MSLILISYDVVNDRRRQRISKLLEDFGGRRVQFSVFECHLEKDQLGKLQKRLAKLLEEEADSIRLYHICANCRQHISYLGQAEPTEGPGLQII